MNGVPIQTPITAQCRVAYGFLALALGSHAVAFPLRRFGGAYTVPRSYSIYLFFLYALFLLVSVLVEVGVLP